MAEPQGGERWQLLLFPETASQAASRIDAVYWALIGASAIVTLVVLALIVIFCVRYRAGSAAPRHSARPGHTYTIELAWSVPIFVVFMVLFVWSAQIYLEVYAKPTRTQKINVIAKQWMWKFQHPQGVREINDLHVPVNRPVALRMTSQDVIHSFYVPALRLKRDVLPRTYTTLQFTAVKPGRYELLCAEYCGLEHSEMTGELVAMEPSAYQDWLQRQGESDSLAQRGQALFQSLGCSGCHVGDSAVRAPSLSGLFGQPVPLANGGTVVADDQYIHDSIVQPQKHVVAGYAPAMPSFKGQVSDAEILELVAYIKSLANEEPPAP